MVEGVDCSLLNVLRPEVKVVPMSERRLKGYRVRSKRPVKNGMALHVGYWKLENNAGSFTQDYVENLGVTEVVASFLLRNSIDIMIFQVLLVIGNFKTDATLKIYSHSGAKLALSSRQIVEN